MDKKALITELQKDYKKYWGVRLFDEQGFVRKQCTSCRAYFWTVDAERTVCTEAPCTPYSFIGIRRKDWDYYETWKNVERFFVKNGHTSVPRYPVICRWRPDLFFTVASIIDFQRKTPKGVEFFLPQNPLIVPQVCLRFNDLPNIGVTGRHHSCFIMLGQHAIPQGGKGYWKDETVRLDWEVLTNVMGIRPDQIVFKEDAWAGGGAAGYSLEYHVAGLELGNAVFTEFREAGGGLEKMQTPVVDMGAGFDRWVWYLNGTLTSYDSAFGPVLEKMKKHIDYDGETFARYSRISGSLNFEDLLDARKAKADVAASLGLTADELTKKIGGLQAVYTIADHAKALLFALNDGGLPSTVGGGYNLRVVLRRAQALIEEHALPFTLTDVMEWHARSLTRMHPELRVDERIRDIVETEIRKSTDTRTKVRKRVDSLIDSKQKITDEMLVTLYDSEGITPEVIEDEAKKNGLDVNVPADFYARVTEKHMETAPEKKAARFDTSALAQTKQLCYTDVMEHDATVQGVSGEWVVLDQSAFYPEGGGQMYDTGTIGGVRVTDVQKENGIVFHKVEKPETFATGDRVKCRVDHARRTQLTQHHDATHIINGCARRVLGTHAWQHGALKDVTHARIDITHYKPLTDAELHEIERCANDVVSSKKRIRKSVHPTAEAEKNYSFTIYQGGVPWGDLRIVDIDGHDIEACGGTHADTTASVGKIIVTGTERVQDGIVRINFVAGDAADKYEDRCTAVVDELAELLKVQKERVPEEVEKLIVEWKAAQKSLEKSIEERAQQATRNMQFENAGGVRLLVAHVAGDTKQMQKISERLTSDDTLIFLFGEDTTDVPVFAAAGANAARDYHVGKLIKEMFGVMGGKGGGTPVLAQGVMPRMRVMEAMEWLKKRLK
ncbi:MAG: alanine--tRNA ligase [Candidatus Aenigmarchaeota archaeon]|nr:alanine--tRNA ligase [Candidatus Aenigmarchaeota archaeon]